MNTIWLEDFLVLADCLNFSRAAERRNVTQPAFGRRIRALEEWAGHVLVDRSSHRLELTDAGRAMLSAAGDIRTRLYSLRRELDLVQANETALTFASTQALSFTFFPEWFRRMSAGVDGAAVRLVADNMQGCERIMEEGQAQFLLCHAHPAASTLLHEREFRTAVIASDRLLPVIASDNPVTLNAEKVPLLAYDERSGLGRIMQAALRDKLANLPTYPVFTSHLAIALKTMAVGHVDKWRSQSLMQATSTKPRKLSAVLS